jgi:uncharacterized protein (DUF362 family)/ferredoxin
MKESNVYLAQCQEYDGETINRHIRRYFELFAPLRDLVKPGNQVLVKPNLCLAHPPEAAVTTHPVLLEQIVTILMENGANVTIGDNPIGKVEKGTAAKIWKISGIDEIARKTGCRKSILDRSGLKQETYTLNGKSFSYYISEDYLNADVVINVPKFKSHALTGLTGAIKNIYGIVPGRAKVQLHGFAPVPGDFAKVIVEIYSKRPPELTVMDAVIGIEGDGPGIKGRVKKIGTLMIGNDGVLIDAISTQMMGMPLEQNLILTEAWKRQLGRIEGGNIHLDGFEKLTDCFVPDFLPPATLRFRNPKVLKKLSEIAKFSIGINPEKCIRCLKCVDNCPVRCISQNPGDDNAAGELNLDKTRCIQCLCCLEICPTGAVEVVKSKFYRDLKKIKDFKKSTNC